MLRKISASAGSGKTYALTETFLEHLEKAKLCPKSVSCGYNKDTSEDYGLSEVLAVTFTNKAAAEMKKRVLRTLKEKALKSHQENHPAQDSIYDIWLGEIFRHSAILNIRTIDSLLNMLVRLAALELKLSPDFELSFEREDFFTPVYDGLMADLNAYKRGVYVEDLSPRDCEKCIKALEDYFSSQIKYSNYKGFYPDKNLTDSIYKLLELLLKGGVIPEDADEKILHQKINELHKNLKNKITLFTASLAKEKVEMSHHLKGCLETITTIDAYTAPPICTLLYKDSLTKALKGKNKDAASKEAELEYFALADCLMDFCQKQSIFKSALPLMPLIVLARTIHKRICLELKDSALLPSISLPRLAKDLLSGESGVPDSLCRIGNSLRHLLLDEFQDTSIDQWQAIGPLAVECLSQGGSISYVGDVKQAIYSWRGGDARLFDSVFKEKSLTCMLDAEQCINDSLPYNWRSSPAIIAHNNAFFSMLADPQIARAVLECMLPKELHEEKMDIAVQRICNIYADSIQDLPPKELKPENIDLVGTVRHYLIEGTNKEDLQEKIHQKLCPLIIELTVEKKWKFKDISILVRSGAEASLTASWLVELGVPVVTENSFLLAENILISRLIALLSFVDYPYNDVAFWEFITGEELFGRLSGLKRENLDRWLALDKQKKSYRSRPIFQRFKDAFPREWERFIAPFHNKAGLMSAYDMIHEAIRHYRLFELCPDDTAFLSRLLELAQAAEVSGKTTLAAFLEFWEKSSEDEKLPLPENMNAIRIMTMHKAKGLEFPVVILPFQHGNRERRSELTEFDFNGSSVLTKISPALPEEFFELSITESIERLNLVYVAWTRPVNELHSFITENKRYTTPLSKALKVLLEELKVRSSDICEIVDDFEKDPDLKTSDQSLSLFDQDDLKKDSDNLKSSSSSVNEKQAEEISYENENFILMDWLPRLKIFRTRLSDLGFGPRQRGSLTHLCLENLYLPENMEDKKSVAAAINQAINQGFGKFSISLHNTEKIRSDLERSLNWFAALPQAPFWLKNGLNEQSVINAEGKIFRVDLLVDEGQAFRAVDYKTGPYTEQNFKAHSLQLDNYMKLFSSAAAKPVRGSLVYLDARKLKEF